MDMLSLSFVLSVLSVGIVVYLLGRRDERQVHRDWRLLLSPRSEEIYSKMQRRLELELGFAHLTYERAFGVRGLESMDEARRLLDVGYKVIEEFAPSMLKLLGAMATFSRMVSAMAPVAPLRPQALRIGQIASLAYLNRFLRHFLVTSTERFRLHLYILGRSFGVATRFLLDATRRIVRNEPHADRNWKEVDAALEDLHTLTGNSLESLRVLLQGLDRQRAEDALADLAEQREPEKQPPDFFTLAVWVAVIAALTLVFQLLR